jgi:hypothetical protein
MLNSSMLDKLKDQIASSPDNAILWAILVITFTVGLLLMIKWQLTPNNGFDLRDIICSDGRLSSSKVARFGAFVVSTWCFVYLTANDKLTEWYFMGYMAAWVGNALFSNYLKHRDHQDHPTTPNRDGRKPHRSIGNTED